MTDRWLDALARRVAARPDPEGAVLTRREMVGRVAVGAFLLAGVGGLARPDSSDARTLGCRKECLQNAEDEYVDFVAWCERFYKGLADPVRKVANPAHCYAVAHDLLKYRVYKVCCDPEKPPAKKKPKGKKPGGSPPAPPPPPPPPADPCATCTYYCDACAATKTGFICCALPPKNGKSPCCGG